MNNNLLTKVMMVAALAVSFAAVLSMFAQDAPKPTIDAKPKIDVAALNATLDKDFKMLKLTAQLAAKNRDNAVLQFQALKTEFDQKTVELNTTFSKASADLETSRKDIFAAFKITDDSVAFDATKGEFVLPSTSPTAPAPASAK